MGFDIIEGMRGAYSVDFLYAVAAGEVPGFAILDKYGRNQAAPTNYSPIWNMGDNDYVWPETPQGLRAYCNDNTATNSMVFETLDSDWGTQTVTMSLTGTTPINLGTGIRCSRAYNIEPGRTIGKLSGIVEVAGSGAIVAGSASDKDIVLAVVNPIWEQTQQAIYSVPKKQKLEILGWWSGINESSGVSAVAMNVGLWVGGLGLPMRNKREVGFTNLGNNPAILPWGVPLLVDPQSDVEMRSLCDSSALDISGGFFGLLIDV